LLLISKQCGLQDTGIVFFFHDRAFMIRASTFWRQQRVSCIVIMLLPYLLGNNGGILSFVRTFGRVGRPSGLLPLLVGALNFTGVDPHNYTVK
jgi:hypothetical protein